MAKEALEVLPIRVPPATRNALASLARMTGMSPSELGRWLLVRAVDQDASATYEAARALAVEKFGPGMAAMLERHELERMKHLTSGAARETADGGLDFRVDPALYNEDGSPREEEPEAAPRREVVRT